MQFLMTEKERVIVSNVHFYIIYSDEDEKIISILCRGTTFSIIAGILYGVNFAPVIYIQDNYKPKPSQNGESL